MRALNPARLFFAATILFLAGLMPAHAQLSNTFGRITEGTIPSNGLSADFKRASRFTVTTAGTITHLCAYLDGNGGVSGAQGVNMALYRDSNGLPGGKVFETSGMAVLSGTAARWFCLAGPQGITLHPVPAGTYWIALQTGSDGGVVRDYGDGAANWYGNADAFVDGAASTFGAGSSGTGTLSVYAQYFPDAQLRNAGRWTIGSIPSSGMSANFKRGSSFVLPERGTLYTATAYFDGGGGAAFNELQNFRYTLYKDSNGVPGAKVFESGDLGMRTGWPGMWVTSPPSLGRSPVLDAGKYWLAILTGGTAGVARNFGDGTPGNWYGNSDSFSDGASAQFGPGSGGNGTISAFVSYRPGTITTGQLGRTDIGTHPSSGLSANFIRWSEFELRDGGVTLTGFNAYLDGRGGAAGSQKVRAAVYGMFTDHRDVTYFYKIAQSPDVTITAGMPPQWVHFSAPSVVLTSAVPIYWVALQSGDTAGVVRDYGDGRMDPLGNWFGKADPFADGALDQLSYDGNSTGAGTLSIYATYSIPPP